ncbi:hypothetical protein BpHYR1_008880 [Brachionus plicatilis]|uniref:Uncharacterized protein n=1 Tax=Brachionus plicatilis TaxID=10195 RepID=A0A3M7P7J1_BRAPC|nr:hypothetical protein BpHYR1_008880 [Brachionus plicatilis]
MVEEYKAGFDSRYIEYPTLSYLNSLILKHVTPVFTYSGTFADTIFFYLKELSSAQIKIKN